VYHVILYLVLTVVLELLQCKEQRFCRFRYRVSCVSFDAVAVEYVDSLILLLLSGIDVSVCGSVVGFHCK